MKTFFLSLLLGGLFAAAAQAQFSAGSDSFWTPTPVPAGGGTSAVTDLNLLSLETGEPTVFISMAPKTAWWRWAAPENGFVAVDTLAQGYSMSESAGSESTVAVYTGTSINALTRVAWGYHYRPHYDVAPRGAAASFYAEKSKVYYIQVGSTFLSPTYHNVRLSVSPLPVKTLQKESAWSYSDESGGRTAGAITVLLNPRGSLTGIVRLKSGTYPFAAVIDEAGFATVSILEKIKPGALPRSAITFHFQAKERGAMLVKHPGNQSFFSEFYDVAPTVALPVGTWSGAMFSFPSGVNSPVTMKVAANQRVTLTAKLEDGSVLTHSGPVLKVGSTTAGLAIMKTLNGGKGIAQAMLFYSDLMGRLEGSGIYARDAKPGAAFYPAGLSATINLSVTPYTKPTAGQRALDFANATLGQASLTITDPTNEVGGNATLFVTLETNNKFVFVADPMRKPTLKLNVATGQVTGSVILAGKKRNIVGSLHNPAFPSISGYVTGTSANVKFNVTSGLH